MKFVFSTLMFLFSIPVAAQTIQYEDGSYYNDDFIRPNQSAPSMKAPVSLHDNTTYIAPAVEKPVQAVVPRKPRRAKGGFQEVRSGGQVGDFREIGGGEDSSPSRGSR